jgi:hypothetical protein
MPARSDEPRPSGGWELLGFSGAVFVFHNLPAVAGEAADWIDLASPFASSAPRRPSSGERRPLLSAFAARFALCALAIGGWALWHGGVPEFSDLGWL